MNPCFPGLRQAAEAEYVGIQSDKSRSLLPRIALHDGRQPARDFEYNPIGQPENPIDKAAPPPDRKI